MKKKTEDQTWESPFSAPCPRLFPATLRSSVLLPPSVPPHTLSLQKLSEKLLRSFSRKPPLFPGFSSLLFFFVFPFSILDLPSQRSLPQPPFLCPTFSAATFSSLSSVPPNGLRDPPSESSSTCQSPIAASKSEVDSLWPLRM